MIVKKSLMKQRTPFYSRAVVLEPITVQLVLPLLRDHDAFGMRGVIYTDIPSYQIWPYLRDLGPIKWARSF